MKITVTQLELKTSERYPYTHRVEFDSSNQNEYELVQDWIKEKEIKCCVMPTFETGWTKKLCVYVDEQDAIRLSLRWL